jgi:hypothetical protein
VIFSAKQSGHKCDSKASRFLGCEEREVEGDLWVVERGLAEKQQFWTRVIGHPRHNFQLPEYPFGIRPSHTERMRDQFRGLKWLKGAERSWKAEFIC